MERELVELECQSIADRWKRIDLAQGLGDFPILGTLRAELPDQVSCGGAFAAEMLEQSLNRFIESVGFQLRNCATSTVPASERVTINASAE
ncbi:hypothetical protein ACE10Z_10585 [Bradyrhizobium sp. Pha-3]|uniref:hypothetical protein n=1 Tax=Bradyrhizobium sp. Pha-3 TaxID=208375 RepID=UPI0035D42AF2